MPQKLFISYNSKDHQKAKWIAWTLQEAGHEVALHEWELPAGGDIPQWMNEKLLWAERLIAVVSPDYVHAKYSEMEWRSLVWEDPDGSAGSVVPVMVRPTPELPPLLRTLKQIDLIGCDEHVASERLRQGIEGFSRPLIKPEFESVGATPPGPENIVPKEKPSFEVNVKMALEVARFANMCAYHIDRDGDAFIHIANEIFDAERSAKICVFDFVRADESIKAFSFAAAERLASNDARSPAAELYDFCKDPANAPWRDCHVRFEPGFLTDSDALERACLREIAKLLSGSPPRGAASRPPEELRDDVGVLLATRPDIRAVAVRLEVDEPPAEKPGLFARMFSKTASPSRLAQLHERAEALNAAWMAHDFAASQARMVVLVSVALPTDASVANPDTDTPRCFSLRGIRETELSLFGELVKDALATRYGQGPDVAKAVSEWETLVRGHIQKSATFPIDYIQFKSTCDEVAKRAASS